MTNKPKPKKPVAAYLRRRRGPQAQRYREPLEDRAPLRTMGIQLANRERRKG